MMASPYLTHTLPDDPHPDWISTVGRPMPQTEIKIVSMETGAIVPVGEIGETCARGYSIMKDYFDDPEATRSAIDSEGWLHTGDLGRLDEHGYCTVQGRRKDMIIRGGENIYPREIEDVLYTHPAVMGASIVGAPDRDWGEVPVGFVQIKPGHEVAEQELSEFCRVRLASYNGPTKSASNKTEFNRHFQGSLPSLIILDLRLGQDGGLDLLREIRSHSDVPVIITTGHRPDEIDRIVGLELGADDYIVKPFSLRELLARVRAVLRRQEMGQAARTHNPERGGVTFDGRHAEQPGRRLLDPQSTPVSLSKGEYALLLAFLEAPHRPLSREHLLQATRIHEDIFDRSIDVQVLRLRRKLEIDPSAPPMIQTERGVGYTFALPVEPF